MGEKKEKRAKLFANGHSQAVRLPKEFRFVGTEVRIRRDGEKVILEPAVPQVEARDLEAARRVLKAMGPVDPNFAEMVEGAMRKLEGA